MLSELQKLFKLIWQKKKNVITNHEHVVVVFFYSVFIEMRKSWKGFKFIKCNKEKSQITCFNISRQQRDLIELTYIKQKHLEFSLCM